VIIVADTNVIVSATIKPFSGSAQILNLILSGSLKLAYDTRIITLYEEVLKREKFGFDFNHIESIIIQIKEEGVPVSPPPVNENLPDKDDLPFLEVAISGDADFIVTGNKKHFPVASYKNVKIVSPEEFIKKYRKTIYK
jgi:uncharacterized protein